MAHVRSSNRSDLFGEVQPDLFASNEPVQPVVYRGDPDRVRARLTKILAEAKAAASMPWTRNDERMYETIVPQMTNWLPPEEAQQWCLAFSNELARLRAA